MKKVTVTRTYLEMLQKPNWPETQWPEGTLVMHAKNPGVAFYRYLYNSVGSDWTWVDRKRMNDDKLKMVIQNPRVFIHVLYYQGTPAGYIELDARLEHEVEIAYFGMMSEFIGKGLGHKLLEWGIREAWKFAPRRVWLHTCTLDHPAALPLYKKIGFNEIKKEEYEIEIE